MPILSNPVIPFLATIILHAVSVILHLVFGVPPVVTHCQVIGYCG